MPAIIFVLLLTGSNCVGATVYTVTTSADSGAGSLRAAVAAATTGDSIVFSPSTIGSPIVLTTGEIDISLGITITGNGPSYTIISGNHSSGVFYVPLTTGSDTLTI